MNTLFNDRSGIQVFAGRTLRLAGIAALLLGTAPRSAPAETVTVPLSDPSRPAIIKAGLVNGGMTIEAWSGKEVVVEAVGRADESDSAESRGRKGTHDRGGKSKLDKDIDEAVDSAVEGALAGDRDDEGQDSRQKEDKSKGMHRIPNSGLGLSVEEAGNIVRIESESWRRTIDLKIKVPVGSSLKLGCVNDGDISVNGVEGDMELSNTNGSITVLGAASTVVANTVNGEVKVTFKKLASFKSMAFSSLNGDIDVSLPAAIAADVRLSSDNGEIYSDFEIQLAQSPAQSKAERGPGGKFKVTIGKEMYGTINGGGADLLFKTFNGDIYIRKSK
ncbi:MAG: DUF4097 family beta strand repeat-containing protein [Acidobacteriota bacterium]